jgi:hypothetical protein
MLSKEVKIRIASNKYFRRVPKWQRQMYEHFRREIATAQRMYDTSKHFEGTAGEALRAVRLANRNLLEQASRTWKRADWLKHLRYQQSLMKHKRQLNLQTFGRLGKPLDLYGDTDSYKKFPEDFQGSDLGLHWGAKTIVPADYETEHQELVAKLIERHQRLYNKTPTAEEASAEVTRIGHENLKDILAREEQGE